MKVVGVIQRYYPAVGGSENLAKNFLDYMSKNHTVTVYTTNAENIQSFWYNNSKTLSIDSGLNYNVVRNDFLIPTKIKYDQLVKEFPFISSYPGPFSPKMWNDLVFKKFDCDLIYATSFPYDHIFPAYIAAKKWNIPIIITPLIHQEFPELYLTATKLTMLNNADSIFVISDSEKKVLVNKGVNEEKISIIQPFINLVSEEKIKNDFRDKFSIGKNKIVLFVGSKSFVKGIIHLIEALTKVWQKKSDVILVVIGPTTEEFRKFYSKLPESIKKKIIDLGITDEKTKKDAISECDLLALPSKSESFGLVYLEAWMYEKPVIGCNILPISDMIENKKNGLLVEFGNINQLKDSILELLDNPSLSQKYGKDGKNKALKLNSQDNLKSFEEKCLSVVDSFRNKKQ